MLKINNLSFARGQKLVLNGINFEVSKSEVLVIKGPNGSGKTTLINNIIGVADPLRGEVTYDGQVVDSYLSSKYFLFIGEKNFSYDQFTVLDNLNYWANLHGIKINKEILNKSIEYLYGNLDIKKKFYQLSFGQKKKINLILLMLINKNVWILDDPFNGLDDISIKKVNSLIATKRDQGGIVIIASHIEPYLNNLKEFRIHD